MLTKKFFHWPYGASLQPAIDEITPLIAKSVLSPYLSGPDGNLAEYIALECRFWNINPWWICVSGQREQSIFTTEDNAAHKLNAWLGFVGQDVGRSKRPGYYGVYMQVQRCAEQTAWLLGVEASEKWPGYVRKDKSSARFVDSGRTVKIETDGEWKDRLICDAGEYVQGVYTPHDHIWKTNLKCALAIGVPGIYIN